MYKTLHTYWHRFSVLPLLPYKKSINFQNLHTMNYHNDLYSKVCGYVSRPLKVSVVGSGNWYVCMGFFFLNIRRVLTRGTTIAKIVADNANDYPKIFQNEVRMWVFEEQINGRNLTDIINTQHENVKYLQRIKLPLNLKADPDIKSAVKGSDLIIFNIPHQFLKNICQQLEGVDFGMARGISCLKGLHVSKDGVSLLSDFIKQKLGIHCGVLSGANLAPEVAAEKYSETTIAYPEPDDYFLGDVDHDILKLLFQRQYFHVRLSPDTAGVSIGGALKNVVAIGAGMVEGAGWGDNAKAAVMRRGLIEMINFGTNFFPDCQMNTFTHESAGVADLITSCAGGRNVRVGREFIKNPSKSIREVETELLNGQSAQGIDTIREVHELLSERNMTKEFPLFTAIYSICFGDHKIEDLPALLQDS